MPGVTIRYWRRCLGGSRVSAAIMARSGPVRLGAGDLTAQDRDLMPQYHDLRIFGDAAAGEQRQPAEQPEHEQINQAEEHECRG